MKYIDYDSGGEVAVVKKPLSQFASCSISCNERGFRSSSASTLRNVGGVWARSSVELKPASFDSSAGYIWSFLSPANGSPPACDFRGRI